MWSIIIEYNRGKREYGLVLGNDFEVYYGFFV